MSKYLVEYSPPTDGLTCHVSEPYDLRRASQSRGETASTDLGWIAEASVSEEPGGGIPHAGICAGAVG
jgi:hypothetical protein